MKTRNDFVSNSSSASFIVITDSGKEAGPQRDGDIVLPDSKFGETEFGWQTEKYDDFWSKLNWCAIVVKSKRDQERYDTPDETLKEQVKTPWFRFDDMYALLRKVCADAGLGEVSVDFGADCYDDPHGGYIDHQSNIGEEPDNGRMFQSEKTLRDFLFNDGSYIDCSNDNGGRDDDEYDWETRRYSSQPPDYYDARAEVAE